MAIIAAGMTNTGIDNDKITIRLYIFQLLEAVQQFKKWEILVPKAIAGQPLYLYIIYSAFKYFKDTIF